ncbi:hypothetical protein RF55_14815, partial [Lasius niger]
SERGTEREREIQRKTGGRRKLRRKEEERQTVMEEGEAIDQKEPKERKRKNVKGEMGG